MPALDGLGFEIIAAPKGAFYIYAGIGRLATDSHSLAMRLLEEAGVTAAPGMDFGDNAPGQHMRFAYTTSAQRLAIGIERMARMLT